MAYTSKYINPLVQFGRISFDLIIEDASKILPNKRIHVSFINSESLSKTYLESFVIDKYIDIK
jgi:hypothetical protein